MARRFQNKRNESGSLLASVFIIAIGFGGCLFVVSAMSPASFSTAAWSLGSVLTVFLALVVWFRFGRTPNSNTDFLISSVRSRRDDGAKDYEPRIAGQSRSQSMAGTNQPITAQEVREIQVANANTWVPANARQGKSKSPQSLRQDD
jgi:hypothetical protein